MIPWLGGGEPDFPPLAQATREPDGLLAAGGALTPEWILAAYRRGIFPWFSAGQPILWWSPDPRMVVMPTALRVSRSLARTLRKARYSVRCDTAFDRVIAACAAPREPGGGTWIVPAMQQAYCELHRLGWAHSVETWIDGELAGGLYGLAIGRVFFGESMFTRVSDASKIAFAHLARDLERCGFTVIDCQMVTAHLSSLGGRTLARDDFAARVADAVQGASPARWAAGRMADINWKEG